MADPTADEALALTAFQWIAGDPGRITAFLSATGLAPGDLRGVVGQTGFLLAVLDFVLTSDDQVGDFCRAHDLPLTAPAAARQKLAGPADWHWT